MSPEPRILQRRLLQLTRAADVARERAAAAERERRAGDHDADRLDVAARRQHVEHVARHDVALRDGLRVDDGRFAGHRDGFFERADLHVGIHVGREVRGELDALADFTMPKPGSVKVTVYVPGRRLTIE